MRKLIGCIVNNPEAQYQTRLLEGIIAQCEAYDYDLAVFSPMIDVTHYFKSYLEGDQNILHLANFDHFDAVVVASTPLLAYDGGMEGIEKVRELLAAKCRKPVVILDSPVDDYPVVQVDDVADMEEITAHILDVHRCNPDKVYILTGPENHVVSERRILGCRKEYEKRGLEFNTDNIIYGDFWYTAGYSLAERIASGELPRPEAVIAHSDHMAMGVIKRLTENGIRVPEDIIVTGHDATEEGLTNDISVTSYIPRVSEMAASAIDRIHEILEPESPLKPYSGGKDNLCCADSCGCGMTCDNYKKVFDKTTYMTKVDYSQGFVQDNHNIGLLIESYMMEDITRSETMEDCLKKIYERTYLFRPYEHFYLCLRENWLDMSILMGKGYPSTMSCAIHAVPLEAENRESEELHYTDDGRYRFDTELMLPALYEERDEPNVFYFFPVHVQNNTLGYCVVQSRACLRVKPTALFRNWLRYVNLGLEMVRIRNRLVAFSVTESMTGLYNRRGMEIMVNEMLSNAKPGDSCFVMLIDMDGLKAVNDKFGHGEGDAAIVEVSSVARSVLGKNEIAVRAGGDEFYIIGVGDYNEQKIKNKAGLVEYYINEKNRNSTKNYDLSVSIGYCIRSVSETEKIEQLIKIADEAMYVNKVERRKNRRV